MANAMDRNWMFVEPRDPEYSLDANYEKYNTYWPLQGQFSYRNLQGFAHFLPKHKPIWDQGDVVDKDRPGHRRSPVTIMQSPADVLRVSEEEFESQIQKVDEKGLLATISALQREMTQEQDKFNGLHRTYEDLGETNSSESEIITSELLSSQEKLKDLMQKTQRCFLQRNILDKQSSQNSGSTDINRPSPESSSPPVKINRIAENEEHLNQNGTNGATSQSLFAQTVKAEEIQTRLENFAADHAQSEEHSNWTLPDQSHTNSLTQKTLPVVGQSTLSVSGQPQLDVQNGSVNIKEEHTNGEDSKFVLLNYDRSPYLPRAKNPAVPETMDIKKESPATGSSSGSKKDAGSPTNNNEHVTVSRFVSETTFTVRNIRQELGKSDSNQESKKPGGNVVLLSSKKSSAPEVVRTGPKDPEISKTGAIMEIENMVKDLQSSRSEPNIGQVTPQTMDTNESQDDTTLLPKVSQLMQNFQNSSVPSTKTSKTTRTVTTAQTNGTKKVQPPSQISQVPTQNDNRNAGSKNGTQVKTQNFKASGSTKSVTKRPQNVSQPVDLRSQLMEEIRRSKPDSLTVVTTNKSSQDIAAKEAIRVSWADTSRIGKDASPNKTTRTVTTAQTNGTKQVKPPSQISKVKAQNNNRIAGSKNGAQVKTQNFKASGSTKSDTKCPQNVSQPVDLRSQLMEEIRRCKPISLTVVTTNKSSQDVAAEEAVRVSWTDTPCIGKDASLTKTTRTVTTAQTNGTKQVKSPSQISKVKAQNNNRNAGSKNGAQVKTQNFKASGSTKSDTKCPQNVSQPVDLRSQLMEEIRRCKPISLTVVTTNKSSQDVTAEEAVRVSWTDTSRIGKGTDAKWGSNSGFVSPVPVATESIDGFTADDKIKSRTTLRDWNPGQTNYQSYINMEGYMEKLPLNKKKATLLKTWKRRYFRAKEGCLFYYEDGTTERSSGIVQLGGGNVEALEDRIIGIDDGRGHYLTLRCGTDEDMDRWLQALKSQTVEDVAPTWIQPVLHASPNTKRKVIVVDIGSCSVRAGILGDKPSLPELFFPSLIATNKSNGQRTFGFDALKPDIRSSHLLSYPIRPSFRLDKSAFDMDAMEPLFTKLFADLHVDPSEYWLMFSSPGNFCDVIKEQFMDLFVNKFKLRGVNIVSQTLLSLYSYQTSTGVFINIGECLEIVPVTDGYVVDGGVTRQPYGGHRVTDFLNSSFTESRYRFFTDVEFQIVRLAVERSCYVAVDFKEEQRKCMNDPAPFRKSINLEAYDLPPGTWQNVTHDLSRFKSSEGLFDTSLWEMDNPSLPKLVQKAVVASPMDTRREMWRNICLSGGVTQLPGFAERLKADLAKMVPSSVRVQIRASPHRYHSAYIGACTMAMHNTWEQSGISADEWRKQGARALKKWHMS